MSSHSDSQAAALPVSSGQPSGGFAQPKKKRHHSNAAAAIAARRSGHAGHGAALGEDGLQGTPFISSSRDASEEDNDDASGYSDSASSLRLASQHQQQSSTGLPTSARDRALVDSKEAHRRPSGSATADKTPSSSSPPRSSLVMTQSAVQEHPNRRPSHAGMKDPHTSATLAKASQALSTKSSTDAEPDAPPRKARNESISSAGSDAGDGHSKNKSNTLKSGGGRIDLGSLPVPVPVTHHGQPVAQTAVATPKAPDAAQRDHVLAQPRRKTSNPSQAVAIVAASKEAEETDGDGEGEGEEAHDGAAANPYDGDVEFAARTPVTQQVSMSPAASHVVAPGGSGHWVGSSSGGLSGLGVATAPVDVTCKRYISSVTAAALTAPGVGEAKEAGEETVAMASPASIRAFIHKAIYEPDPARPYRINQPVDGDKNPARPIRIYADGVYDLFHYAHALQLRQAKLFFPSVHLIVGVVSSASCAKHKNAPVLTSSERYTSVRNCKWVDEVAEDAPWVITQEFLDKYQIDYVAHDEEPYVGSDGDADIYKICKDQGRFLPTQRTKGVSTSELLARIVEQYRRHDYDKKLAKIGHEELAFH